MQKYKTMKNDSTTYFDGSEWTNNEGLKYVVISKVDEKVRKSYPYFLCEFEDGTIIKAMYSHIYDGQIKNPNNPSLCKVGYFGVGKWKSCINRKRTREYNLWKRIINSCYNENDKDYGDYGGRGVKVDNSWHNFQTFCEEIQNLEGYQIWFRNNSNYELDKDKICIKNKIIPKLYSKDTCVFISRAENSAISNSKGLTYEGERIEDGYKEEFIYMTDFARKYELVQQMISRCILEKQKKHRGWKFRIK